MGSGDKELGSEALPKGSVAHARYGDSRNGVLDRNIPCVPPGIDARSVGDTGFLAAHSFQVVEHGAFDFLFRAAFFVTM